MLGRKIPKAEYNAHFPPFCIYGKDPDPPLHGTDVSGMEAPIYGLGYLIYCPWAEIRYKVCKSPWNEVILDNWKEKDCQPPLDSLERYGLMAPDMTALPHDYIFVRIGINSVSVLEGLQTDEKRNFLFRQATLALGLELGSFDPVDNLVWKRWPRSRKTRELDLEYPSCKWRHEWWPCKDKGRPDLNDNPPHSKPENFESLPHLPKSLVEIIECRHRFSSKIENA
ncbi:hypothetical protein DFP72DRAFT_935314 [Ephemerocybe angulata]|uniref:Uncharacterized protein n=1 Tax=Ephemerocybe angulata TaxID=980116 RepID=A0A8H6HBI5_9AGAR|nr:hypothetical protein DFP72DRAFT_935314 [Tulosesus angulatus]